MEVRYRKKCLGCNNFIDSQKRRYCDDCDNKLRLETVRRYSQRKRDEKRLLKLKLLRSKLLRSKFIKIK